MRSAITVCAIVLTACSGAEKDTEPTASSTGGSTGITDTDTTTATTATTATTTTTGTDTDASSTGQDTGVEGPASRILVTLVSHNEDTATGMNPACVALRDALESRWAPNRQALLDLAEIIDEREAAWSFQSDIEYVGWVLDREPADDNILRDLAHWPSGRISVESHAHEGPGKNYADIANALEVASGVRLGVVGGFTAVACTNDDIPPVWEKFWEPLNPKQPGAPFIATVLTDGAAAGHGCDPSASGVWRPASHEEFFTHDPSAPLPNIGPGLAGHGLDEGLTAVATLVEDLRAGRLEEHRLYTASLTLPQCDFDLEDSGFTPTDIAGFIDGVNALKDGSGDLDWATFPEILDVWVNEYDSQPSIWQGAP